MFHLQEVDHNILISITELNHSRRAAACTQHDAYFHQCAGAQVEHFKNKADVIAF